MCSAENGQTFQENECICSSSRPRLKKKRILQLMDNVTTTVIEQTNSNTAGICSSHAASRQSQTTVWRCMQLAFNAYTYKIHLLQELKCGDNVLWEMFALTFLTWMEVEHDWPWNTADEAHFYMCRTINTHNCHMWSTENPHQEC